MMKIDQSRNIRGSVRHGRPIETTTSPPTIQSRSRSRSNGMPVRPMNHTKTTK